MSNIGKRALKKTGPTTDSSSGSDPSEAKRNPKSRKGKSGNRNKNHSKSKSTLSSSSSSQFSKRRNSPPEATNTTCEQEDRREIIGVMDSQGPTCADVTSPPELMDNLWRSKWSGRGSVSLKSTREPRRRTQQKKLKGNQTPLFEKIGTLNSPKDDVGERIILIRNPWRSCHRSNSSVNSNRMCYGTNSASMDSLRDVWASWAQKLNCKSHHQVSNETAPLDLHGPAAWNSQLCTAPAMVETR